MRTRSKVKDARRDFIAAIIACALAAVKPCDVS
jgi:hypothetical protein